MEPFWRKNQKLLLSLAMALGLVVLFKIFGVLVYETNDDTILASLSYGYYGTPQGLLVYIHPLMGQALALLQRAVPGISWYFLMELGLLWVSIAVFDRLILERFRGAQALPALAVLNLYCVYGMLFQLQYTKIAGAASIAGLLLLFWVAEENKGWGSWLLGLLLGLAGYCLRSDAFLMILIPLSGVGLAALVRDLKNRDFRRAGKLVGSVLLLFALCGGLMLAEQQAYSQDAQWQHYRKFNALRTELLDYGFPDYETNQALYDSLGISEEDLELYRGWDFGDPERFNIQTMEALCNAKERAPLTPGRLLQCLKGSVQGLLRYDFSPCFLLALGLWAFFTGKKGIFPGAWAVAAVFGTEAFLLLSGRGLRERVDAPLMLAATVLLLLSPGGEGRGRGRLNARACAMLAGAMLLGQSAGLLSRKDRSMEDYVGGAHIQAAFREMSKDKSTLYFLRTDERPRDLLPKRQGGFGYYSNIATLGGWLTDSPYTLERNRAYGVENPFRDMVDREDVALVSNDPQPVLDYIRAHYAPDAQAVETGLLRGEYKVFRIVSGERP